MSVITSLSVWRLRHVFVGGVGVVLYSTFCWLAVELGLVEPLRMGIALAAALGAVGFSLTALALLVDFDIVRRVDRTTVAWSLAAWGNLALILTSFVVVTPLRALLLVATLFGLTFTALNCDRQIVYRLALSMWVTLTLATLAHVNFETVPRFDFELGVWLVYSLSLLGGVLVAGEVATLRAALMRRTCELEKAMGKLQELAMRDDLTGLYNRRQLMDFLQRQKALADRGTQGFAVCYVDLDHFKHVNDQFGHRRGDEVLKAFAEVAARVVREEDFVARIGGEEFVLVLVNTGLQQASRVAERLRRQTQVMMVDPHAPDYMVTASVGLAAYNPTESISELLNRADAAMYAAKSQGRNRVLIAPVVEPMHTGENTAVTDRSAG